MIFKKTVSITASTAAGTTFITEPLVGSLMSMRLIKGTMTTKKTMTFGLRRAGVDDSTTAKFMTVALKTSNLNYTPRLPAHGGAAGATNITCPVVMANDQIKIWVQACTSSASKTATALFYIDGIPGLGGTTTT